MSTLEPLSSFNGVSVRRLRHKPRRPETVPSFALLSPAPAETLRVISRSYLPQLPDVHHKTLIQRPVSRVEEALGSIPIKTVPVPLRSKGRIRCAFDVANCKHALATRKCNDCVPFDTHKSGYMCEACYVKLHPWYRASHNYSFVHQRPVPPAPVAPKNKVAHDVLTDTMSLLDRARQTEERLDRVIDTEKVTKSLKEGASKCDDLIERMANMILNLRDDVWASRNTAAIRIQRLYRAVRATRAAIKMTRLLWGKVWDPVVQQWFYVSRADRTRTTWDPPMVGRHVVDVPVLPSVLAADISVNDAALRLQRAWRRMRARRATARLLLGLYRRVPIASEATGSSSSGSGNTKEPSGYYYFHLVNRTSQWRKPLLLGPLEPELYRPWEDAVAVEQASFVIVKWWRGVHARFRLWRRACLRWEVSMDEERQRPFYYDKWREVSVWRHPVRRVLKRWGGALELALEDSLPDRPSRTVAATAMFWPGYRLRVSLARARAQNWTPEEAGSVISAFGRVVLARIRMRNRIRALWNKVFDSEYGAYYYFNLENGKSTWEPPKCVSWYANLELDVLDDGSDNVDSSKTTAQTTSSAAAAVDLSDSFVTAPENLPVLGQKKKEEKKGNQEKELQPIDVLKMHWNRIVSYNHYALRGKYHRDKLAALFKKHGTRMWELFEKKYPITTNQFSVGLPYVEAPHLKPSRLMLVSGELDLMGATAVEVEEDTSASLDTARINEIET